MYRRTNESPMDFEWQTEAPADVTSPFYQLTRNQALKKGFQSPIKPANSTPAQSNFFASSNAHPATPFRNPSFTTPRKPFDESLFSEASGAESSPADNADAEDTPEVDKPVKTMTAFTSNKKPIFGRYGLNALSNSPGRGEVRRGKYDNIVQKVRKRKRMERDVVLNHGRHSSWDSDTDSEGKSRGRKEHRDAPSPAKQNWFSAMLSGIENRPSLPYILSYYAQLLLNYFLVFFVIYLVWNFFLTIRADVDKASEAAAASVLAEMAQCAQQYAENRCAKDMRVPAMETICQSWETCMNRDPSQVGRARVSAHTFAEIFNSFVEPISWKAMVFVTLIITICILVNNFAFSLFRSKATHPPPGPYYSHVPPTPFGHPTQDYQWGPIGAVPQTPRQASGGHDMYGAPIPMTPFQSILPPQTPGRTGSPRKLSRY